MHPVAIAFRPQSDGSLAINKFPKLRIRRIIQRGLGTVEVELIALGIHIERATPRMDRPGRRAAAHQAHVEEPAEHIETKPANLIDAAMRERLLEDSLEVLH